MIVKDHYIGNTRVKVYDDYCVTPAEVEAILKRCAQIVMRSERGKRDKESRENGRSQIGRSV